MVRVGVLVLVLVALLLLAAATAQAQGGYGSISAAPAASPEESCAVAPSASPPADQAPPPATSPQSASPPAPPPPSAPTPKLRFGFYKRSCPYAEEIVRQAVRNATNVNPGLGAGLVRMAFHDCFVQGCDGSVLLDPTPANPRPEKLGPPNFPSLRGYEVVDAAKAALEKACPGVVSCADVVQFAARDAVFFLSGYKVYYSLPGGRFDGRVSFENETLDFLPPPFFTLPELIRSFKVKGMSVDDLVVLSGSHTIGRSHCSSFVNDGRLNASSDMNPSLSTVLKRQCPARANFTNDPTVVQDVVTPNKLDNQYFKNVLNHKVLFISDAALLNSTETAKKVVENAFIRGRWERKFAKAMVKMSLLDIKTAANGEIRKKCHVVN